MPTCTYDSMTQTLLMTSIGPFGPRLEGGHCNSFLYGDTSHTTSPPEVEWLGSEANGISPSASVFTQLADAPLSLPSTELAPS